MSLTINSRSNSYPLVFTPVGGEIRRKLYPYDQKQKYNPTSVDTNERHDYRRHLACWNRNRLVGDRRSGMGFCRHSRLCVTSFGVRSNVRISLHAKVSVD